MRVKRAHRERAFALGIVAMILLALLAVFGTELANTQAKSKQDVKARVHERAKLAAALIDSLLQTAQKQRSEYARTYGARTLSTATLDKQRQGSIYLAVLDSTGHMIAHSRGFTSQARADLGRSAALRLVREGHPYALGNLLPLGNAGVINFAIAFPTRFGQRILLTGVSPGTLAPFLGSELSQIPGVKGSFNYVLDRDDVVLASNNKLTPPGYVLTNHGQANALKKPSGEESGYYFDHVPITHSTWRIVLSSPKGPLFASVSGLRKWVPWLIFLAFAVVALVALLLGTRTFRASDQVHAANAELERLNAELANSNASLERNAAELARSNAELEQFASIASHDLQEPLRKIRTFTQQLMVTETDRLSDKGQDYMERTNAAAARLQRLIEDLLRFSRVATHGRPFDEVDLAQVTREVLEDLESQVAGAQAHVQVGELPIISADALQMRQLMQNLISNAIKFRREGVTPEVKISATVADDCLRLQVVDNGIGFEPQYSRRIFRVFERLHGRSEYPGTGIGLALCRRIAERHGGTIFGAGEPGLGSTFTVTLPMRHSSEERLVVTTDSHDDAVPEAGRVSVTL